MKRRHLRIAWLALIAVIALWSITSVGGLIAERPIGTGADTNFTLVALVADLLDPLAFTLALACALLAGRWTGLRMAFLFLLGLMGDESAPARDPRRAANFLAASRSLAAGARGLLWGSFLLSAFHITALLWPEFLAAPAEFMTSLDRLSFVGAGALFAVIVGVLVLLPSAARARSLAGVSPSDTTKRMGRLDVFVLCGHFACLMVLLLEVFFLRYRLVAEPGPRVDFNFFLPTLGGVNWQLVAWSLLFMVLLPWLALIPTAGVSAVPAALLGRENMSGRENSFSRGLMGQYRIMLIACGLLAAVIVELAGINSISTSGGNADPRHIQRLTGQMLVPFVIGLLLAGGTMLQGMRRPEGRLAEGRLAEGPIPN